MCVSWLMRLKTGHQSGDCVLFCVCVVIIPRCEAGDNFFMVFGNNRDYAGQPAGQSPERLCSLAIYLPSMSNSIFTTLPSCMSQKFVCSKVYGMMAT